MKAIGSVLLVDDHSIIRLGTSLLIREILPGVVIWQASTFEEAVNITQSEKPDLVLLDIDIPGGGGIDMVSVLKLRHPGAKILVFTCYDELIFGMRYIHAGADGFLSKHADGDTFKTAVHKVIHNEKYISDKLKDQYIKDLLNERSVSANPVQALSNRELEVAGLLSRGTASAEIATQLNLQISTVSTYKARIFEKMKVGNIIDLAAKMRLYKVS